MTLIMQWLIISVMRLNRKLKYCIFIMGLVGSNYPMNAHVTGVAHSFFQSHNLKTVTMSKTNEIWKDIPNFEGKYQVSNLGRVKSLERYKEWRGIKVKINERILKSAINSVGYPMVALHNNNQRSYNVHQLMAFAFLNYKLLDKKLIVDHINNIKTDNRLENLQIITYRINVSKDRKNKSSKYTGVSYCKQTKKWRAAISINSNRKHIGRFNNEYDAHLAYQNELKKLENG